MSYPTWDWTRETGSGRPTVFDPYRLSPMLKQDKESGYQQTAPLYTKDYWKFSIEFGLIFPASYIYLVDLWHSVRGGQLFYLSWPWGLYGIPLELYNADPSGSSPWSSEFDVSLGNAPTWLCHFTQDQIPLRRLKTHENYWQTASAIEVVTC